MALIQILQTFCRKSGWDPNTQRAALIPIINSAAKEIYEFTDLPGSLREIVALVPPGNIIALPYYVGELRAMREYYSFNKVLFREMAPKYSYQPWKELWSNWRVLAKSPIQNTITNATIPIVLTIAAPETEDIVVTFEGRTTAASRITEPVTIAAGQVTASATEPFIELYSITKTSTNDNDITVTGYDQNSQPMVLALIPNNRLESRYTIVDVSKLPSGGEQGTANRYIEVLYKEPLFYMTEDGDTFPAEGFDDAIAYKALEHEASTRENGSDMALAWYEKCVQILNQRTEHTNGSTQKEMMMAPNGYLGLWPRFVFRSNSARRNFLFPGN